MWRSLEEGEAQTAEELLPIVYEELRKLAVSKMAHEAPGQTLQATALVHEAWLRLAGEDHPWENRRHFFAAAAEAMRRILVDRARAKGRAKLGGGATHIALDCIDVAMEAPDEELLRVHEALESLADQDPVKAELVKLRFFVGLRIPDAAEVLGLSESTANRYWVFARAWLYDKLKNKS